MESAYFFALDLMRGSDWTSYYPKTSILKVLRPCPIPIHCPDLGVLGEELSRCVPDSGDEDSRLRSAFARAGQTPGTCFSKADPLTWGHGCPSFLGGSGLYTFSYPLRSVVFDDFRQSPGVSWGSPGGLPGSPGVSWGGAILTRPH